MPALTLHSLCKDEQETLVSRCVTAEDLPPVDELPEEPLQLSAWRGPQIEYRYRLQRARTHRIGNALRIQQDDFRNYVIPVGIIYFNQATRPPFHMTDSELLAVRPFCHCGITQNGPALVARNRDNQSIEIPQLVLARFSPRACGRYPITYNGDALIQLFTVTANASGVMLSSRGYSVDGEWFQAIHILAWNIVHFFDEFRNTRGVEGIAGVYRRIYAELRRGEIMGL
ncbi:hypothetical protein J3E72DRAFT_380092 [Bipolaris maydis]|nr:hypothetical protein J3E72DRAFT_380092 [Bipolaris maydis]